jgi:hypothetical protein
LSLRVQQAEKEKTAWRIRDANEAIDKFLTEPRPEAEQFKIVAEVLKSRMDRNSGNSETTDKLIARYAALGGSSRPVLLYSKPIEMNEFCAARATANGPTSCSSHSGPGNMRR